jgi:O-antigen/teichoic acid export membrane protein
MITPSPGASEAFRYLMAGCAAFSLQYVFGTLLTALGELRTLIRIAIFAFALNVVLNALLIPVMGASGSAIANVSAQGLMLALQILSIRRITKVRIAADFRIAGRFMLITALLAALLGRLSEGAINGVHFAYIAAAYFLIAGIAAIAVRMIDVRAMGTLLGKRE